MDTAWHDERAFWQELQGVIFSARRCADAPVEVETLLRLANVQTGAAVLDMPCGVGRHSIELAKRGCRVTGVDRYQPYVEHAARRARDERVEIELLPGDMREFRRDSAFDLTLNLYTSLGYFEDLDDERRVLANFHHSLRPGGALVVEMMSKEIMARIFEPRTWTELDDGSILREERVIEDGWRFIRTTWTMIKGAQRYEHVMRLRVFAASELVDLLTDAGFGGVEVYGSLEGVPYDQHAQRLVVVARRI